MWDLNRGQEIQSLGGHPNNVNCVRYYESQRTCYSVSSSYIKVSEGTRELFTCS